MSFSVFKGNCPSNVSKDAKYTVRWNRKNQKSFVIGLIYESEDDEVWHTTTDKHPDLIEMVNEVKIQLTGFPNGSFYINEYHQVIVPIKNSYGITEYYCAGKYHEPLRFEFEGKVLSGEPVDLDGNQLKPGDDWLGPHPGISYVLKAGGHDIYYTYSPRPNVTKKVFLSKVIGIEKAKRVAGDIASIKGSCGGRFYVNEFGCIFAPINSEYKQLYKYIGQISKEEWFPEIECK